MVSSVSWGGYPLVIKDAVRENSWKFIWISQTTIITSPFLLDYQTEIFGCVWKCGIPGHFNRKWSSNTEFWVPPSPCSATLPPLPTISMVSQISMVSHRSCHVTAHHPISQVRRGASCRSSKCSQPAKESRSWRKLAAYLLNINVLFVYCSILFGIVCHSSISFSHFQPLEIKNISVLNSWNILNLFLPHPVNMLALGNAATDIIGERVSSCSSVILPWLGPQQLVQLLHTTSCQVQHGTAHVLPKQHCLQYVVAICWKGISLRMP